MIVTLDINERVYEKVAYLLEHLKDDVTILSTFEGNLEVIDKDDPDYRYIEDARKRRAEGEKCYSHDEVIKALS